MNFPLRVARRYLFAKKSTNAINVITGISVLGIAIGTTTLVLVLSVFNGFEDLLTGMFNSFNPDIKVTASVGKTFSPDSAQMAKIKGVPGVLAISKSLEEVAFFEFEGNQDVGILKGVDDDFLDVVPLDSVIREGEYRLRSGNQDFGILGLGMRNKLSVSANEFSMINVYMAKQKSTLGGQAFRRKFLYPAGTFVIQQDYDNQYILSSLSFAEDLMKKKGEVSALEIKTSEGADLGAVKSQVLAILGDQVRVQDRYEQDASFLKLMNLEKWLFYALFSLALILVAFNIVGALLMIVIDKKKDIGVLKSLGATDQMVRKIFLNEGLLICGLGLLIGFGSAMVLYVLQKTVVLVPIPAGFVVDAYPIEMRIVDFFIVALTVMLIGWVASLPAANRAAVTSPIIREE
ncbi:MAG: FtsX-like permease family protein [Saprospiraceae bacterium]|nr:FtsX-like permease family protein [Saprospiraceae bacterium]